MANKLATAMKKVTNVTRTENGALSNKSTLNAVLDFFYHAPARRGQASNVDLFINAFNENPRLAVKMLFYLRDVRGGKGERESFRLILRNMYENNHRLFDMLVSFVPEYGRWDDILEFTDSNKVKNIVTLQLQDDLDSDHPSLLAKWMPSINTSSADTRKLAREWVKILDLSEKDYRKLLSGLRAKINIVETAMSDNEWETINYSAVPGRAMKLYRKAYGRHDFARFDAFINKAMKGEVKINASTVYPYELVSGYLNRRASLDKAIEAQWNQLPNYCSVNRNAIAIADVSGSMTGRPMEVAVSLAIYLAQRNNGAFKNLFMTFTDTADIISLPNNCTLQKAVKIVSESDWGGSTNLQAAFSQLLRVAVNNDVPQEDMPAVLYIISDMEFNSCVMGTNLDVIKLQYKQAGYKLPYIVFWNVDSRHNQVPATADENGVYLVSGFSPEAFVQTLNMGAKNPEELMLEVLNSDRYSFVDTLL